MLSVFVLLLILSLLLLFLKLFALIFDIFPGLLRVVCVDIVVSPFAVSMCVVVNACVVII